MNFEEVNSCRSIKPFFKEIFKDIPGYIGIYQVSNFGRVKSLSRKIKNGKNSFLISKEKILKCHDNGKRYLTVVLSDNNRDKYVGIHILMGVVFLGNRKGSMLEINHIDCNKQNNIITNLELVTHKENMVHARANNLITVRYDILKKCNENKKIKVKQYSLDGIFIQIFDSMSDVYRKIGVMPECIGRCLKGKQRTAGGFIWKKYYE